MRYFAKSFTSAVILQKCKFTSGICNNHVKRCKICNKMIKY
ncbi:hypothetical protein HMPREF1574_00801 [Gardnerella pickettii JCP7659]|uniref:Uncharacterized protein n=1 Tax=Gardnerella pickettii JCP7719 TaxID=1261061 RepID=S4H4L0_9BIFI|nr:hypothetical protein HMPREF1583_00804 [Gardnerella vaginalis JCP8151B]EPI48778.1 hypothetical protein HMPREF1582_00045 [Gardnerella vaginalis JCP8151A]EPI50888.1 hypothetical protein HMPREF1576_00617 [Gardnerella pickettii JCP7719]EPI55054.1 hypothetical protein HMPREF1574_00801 [Gardnerella pickettii JCP7659]